MSPVLQSFPQRNLKLKPGRGRGSALMIGLLGLAFAVGMIAALSLGTAQAIWTDWQVRETAVASGEARLVTGSCRTRALLLHSCRLTLAWSSKGRSAQREVEYLFVAPGTGNFNVQARLDPQRPELLTTDLGQDYLWNRIATAGAMALLGLLGGYAGLRAAVRGFREAGAVGALSGRNLQPVPVQFVAWGGEPSWTVRDEFGRTYTWPVRKNDKPFVLDHTMGLVLALREAPGAPAFPLDEKLRLVELTPHERQRIQAAQAGVMPNAPA